MSNGANARGLVIAVTMNGAKLLVMERQSVLARGKFADIVAVARSLKDIQRMETPFSNEKRMIYKKRRIMAVASELAVIVS